MWAETACNLIGVAHNSGYFQFLALIQDHMDEANYTIVHLLEDLGLFRAAAFYAGRGVFEHPRQDWEWTDPLEEFLHGLDKKNHQHYYNASYVDRTSTDSRLALDNTSTEDDDSIISDDFIYPAESQHDRTRRIWASVLFEGVFPSFD